MLSELDQLLACRRERENRAAAALRQVRQHLEQQEAALEAAEAGLDAHHQDRRLRQDKLYKRSLRSRLSKFQVDDLNIELDLMAEETDALNKRVLEAKKAVEAAEGEVAEAAARYRKHRQAGDRWGHLVDDVAESERRRAEQIEEFTIEDDLADRRTASMDGGW